MLSEHTKNMHDAIMYITFLGKVAVTIFRKKPQYMLVAEKETGE